MKKKKKKKTDGAPPWAADHLATENAARVLPALAEQYFRDGRAVLPEKTSSAKLHRFRLKTKRFRYTLELFRSIYGPGLEARLRLLRKVQQFLGEANDCAAARALLDGRQVAPEAAAYLESREAERAAEFRSFWRGQLDAPGHEERWIRYLRDFAGRSRKK